MRWLGVLLAALVVLSACSGIPRASAPQVVSTVDQLGVGAVGQSITPQPGDDARTTVVNFLKASVDTDELHQEARAFLIPKTGWNASTATVFTSSGHHTGTMVTNPRTHTRTVTVTGDVMGTVDANGVYTPTITGGGSGRSFLFVMQNTRSGWRIKTPPNGLIIDATDFSTHYPPHEIYFFNQYETALVPDLRYSALEGQSLASWMLDKLVAGPQVGPQAAAVRRNEISTDLDTEHAKVTLGDRIVVLLPGVAQLQAATTNRIAAELAYTLANFAPKQVELSDAAGPISGVPEYFDVSNYSRYAPLAARTAQQMFYVRGGGLVSSTTHRVLGSLGSTRAGLASAAVGPADAGGARPVVGLRTDGRHVVSGTTEDTDARTVALPAAATSRPTLNPQRPSELWIGLGARLVRLSGTTLRSVPYTAAQGVPLPGRTVRSVRFSADGARMALVLETKSSSALWIGQILSVQGAIQVVDLRQITPNSWYVTDATWTSATQLELINAVPFSDFQIKTLYADGRQGSDISVAALPGPPQDITASPANATRGISTCVSVDSTLWCDESIIGAWQTPTNDEGSAPIYSV